MDPLPFFVDQCNCEWLTGWIGKDIPVRSLSVTVNGVGPCALSPEVIGADLGEKDSSDVRSTFRFNIGAYMCNGVNRVAIAVAGQTLYQRDVLVLGSPTDRPGNLINGIIRPLFGDWVWGYRTAVVASIKDDVGLLTCELRRREGFDPSAPKHGEILYSAPLTRSELDPSVYSGEIELPASSLSPVDCVLTICGEKDDPIAGTLLRAHPPQYRSISEYTGQSNMCENGVLGPLHMASSSFSNFPAENAAVLSFERDTSPNFVNTSVHRAVYEVYPAESYDASKNFLRELSIGTELPQFKFWEDKMKWQSAPAYFCRLPEVKLFTNLGFTLFENKYVWSDSCVPVSHMDPTYRRVPGVFCFDEHLYAALPRHKRLNLPSAPFTVFHHHNYAHWLHNSVTAAWHAHRLFGETAIFILPAASALMLDSLRLLGISDSAVISVYDAVCAFDCAIYPSFINTHSNMYPTVHNMGAFAQIKESVDRLGDCGDSPTKIYISRSGEGGGGPRILQNDQELSEALAKSGFRTVRTHELSFLQEVRFFRNAEIIVGQWGAGLFNMVWAPEGCVVVEICNDTVVTNELLWDAALNGHRYLRVMSKTISAWHPDYPTFEVDVDAVRGIIDAIEKL